MRNGSRESSATAFIHPALSARSNIDVLLNSQVTKVIQTSNDTGVPAFRGVQFATSANSEYLMNDDDELMELNMSFTRKAPFTP